ncbi:hypothetical protein NYE47_02400 [Paenibacillus sp. FSL H7-0941]
MSRFIFLEIVKTLVYWSFCEIEKGVERLVLGAFCEFGTQLAPNIAPN